MRKYRKPHAISVREHSCGSLESPWEIAFEQVVLLIDRNDDPLYLMDLLYSDPQLSLSYRLSTIVDLLDGRPWAWL